MVRSLSASMSLPSSYMHISNDSLCCKRGSKASLKLFTMPRSPGASEACAANCSAHRRCSFYSTSLLDHSRRAPVRCELCSECTLRRPPTLLTKWGGTVAASTWAREWEHIDTEPRTVSEFVEEWLSEHLQTEYSQAIYRQTGAVRFSELRVLWLRLLPPRALSMLTRIQACHADAPCYGTAFNFGLIAADHGPAP